jgi:hypothetical protein
MSELPISSSEMVFSDAEVMSVRGAELESETVPLVAKKGNGASENPFAPGTNPRLKKPMPPPRKKEAEKKPEPDDEEQAPPSGTPSLTALMGSSVRPKPKGRVDEDFFSGISGPQATTLAPPTIDVSSFGAPASADSAPESAPPSSGERAPDSIPVSTHEPHKKKKKKHGRTSSQAPAASKTSAGATAKPVTRSAPAAPMPETQKGSSLPWVLLGLVVIGGGGFFVYNSQQNKPAEPTTVETAAATAEVAPTAPAPTVPTAEAIATASATASAAPTVNKPAEVVLNKPAEAKPTEAKPAEEKPLEEKPAEAKPAEEKPAEAKPAVGAAFDQAAAKAALAAVAAQAAGCRKGDDPPGNAVVIITFATSGRVTSANVNGPPFAGTPTGGCIASAMRKAQVPPFDGERITVSKTVSIQ